jgi:DNA replication and repair protein RecF
MRSLAIEWLRISGFRNLSHAEVALGPGVNVLRGDNGQGKTNVLEALYVLATSRSFRTSKLAEIVQVGLDVASVRAQVREEGEVREQSVGLRGGRRLAQVDGKRTASLAAYAVRSPVVVFHPGAVALSAGASSERRKLLDRVALYRSPASLADAADYARALRARQRLLDVAGERARGLDEWEALVVRHGMALSEAREEAASELGSAASEAFQEIGPADLELRVQYERSAPREQDAFRDALVEARARDRVRRSASLGPHRDDLSLRFGERPVRGMASQGQHRSVVLALELAEMEVIRRARGVRPVLLLDDVSSELDRDRTAALLRALQRQSGQVLLTTTRPELIDGDQCFGLESRRDFVVVRGEISVARTET